MSDGGASDPFAAAKANLRDTIKWLATSLAAVGAAVIAGASINGLAALQGMALLFAALLGGSGLVLILIAIAVMVNLLTSNVFYFSQLTQNGNKIAGIIDEHATDILSPQTKTIAALVKYREDAVTQMEGSKPGDEAYKNAFKKWTAANDLIARVTNLAQFLSFREEFEARKGILFLLTIGIILTLGGYALLAGGKSSLNAALAQKAVFQPGADWSAAAALLAKACGSDPLLGSMVPKKTFEGWVTIRLSEPGKCAGLEITVPASLTQIAGPSL